jgi:hypothetical protein
MHTLDQLAPDLWTATRPLPIVVGDIGARMTVIRLPDRNLMLHSPVELDAALKSAIEEIGTVRWVVGPSRAHHLFLAGWVSAFPGASLCGAPGLAEKRRDLHFHQVLRDQPPEGWPEEVSFLLVEGAPIMNEVALLHRPSRTLILTDLVFNVAPENAHRARIFHWMVGASGRFGPHRLIRLGIRDRAAARRSIDSILEWDFDRIVMCHGEVVPTGGRERLANAFSFLPSREGAGQRVR